MYQSMHDPTRWTTVVPAESTGVPWPRSAGCGQPRLPARRWKSRLREGGERPVGVTLGIETSCDETGVGLVADGVLLGQALASSMDEHARFGGVVPEIAARAHLEAMPSVLRVAFDDAGLT